jgi:SNF2 family DNA or RNA helicase
VHRLGQRKATRVLRLLAADTIEQNVLRLQEQKLMQSGGAGGGQARELLVEDCPGPPVAA